MVTLSTLFGRAPAPAWKSKLTPRTKRATTIFVSPSGSDSNAGTLDAPLASINAAVELATAGNTIYLREGTHTPTENIQITKSGTADAPYTVAAYNGEKVVADREELPYYGNHDPRKNGESADGLAVKQGFGEGNVIRGSRLWNNVDDGMDFIEFRSPVTVETTYAWGNGFNAGGGDKDIVEPAAHVITNCIAFSNAAGGFVDNS
ncbi:pectin lyase fold/virulence factor [Trametes elegans]|nr:pectin lyase fold/virulence factor [Trametes elegans]